MIDAEPPRDYNNAPVSQTKVSAQLGTLNRALCILSCFSSEAAEWGVTALAERLRINKSAVHRILTTLESQGVVERTKNRRYALGLKMFLLGKTYREGADVTAVAPPVMKRLADAVRLSVRISRMEGGKVYDLLCVDSPEPLKLFLDRTVGREASCCAVGKIYLAHSTDLELDEYLREQGLPGRTRRSIRSREALTTELAKVRREGYAVDNCEFVPWLRDLAAPVYDDAGHIVGGLCISGTPPEMPLGRIPVLARCVLEAAEEISRDLGWEKKSE